MRLVKIWSSDLNSEKRNFFRKYTVAHRSHIWVMRVDRVRFEQRRDLNSSCNVDDGDSEELFD